MRDFMLTRYPPSPAREAMIEIMEGHLGLRKLQAKLWRAQRERL